MKRTYWVMTVVAMFAIFTAAAAGAVATGPEEILIYGGVSGKVHFPHAQHQHRIGDCNVCHEVFPQKADAIKTLKEEGKLKPKKVMNLQCIKCHKQEKRAGKPHGPLTCNQCHVK